MNGLKPVSFDFLIDAVRPLLSMEQGGVAAVPIRNIYGVPIVLSSAISVAETQGGSSDCRSVYLIDRQQLVVGVRQDVPIELDRSVAFSTDQTAIRAILRADPQAANAAAITRIIGVRP